jgi:hypothetical protein
MLQSNQLILLPCYQYSGGRRGSRQDVDEVAGLAATVGVYSIGCIDLDVNRGIIRVEADTIGRSGVKEREDADNFIKTALGGRGGAAGQKLNFFPDVIANELAEVFDVNRGGVSGSVE